MRYIEILIDEDKLIKTTGNPDVYKSVKDLMKSMEQFGITTQAVFDPNLIDCSIDKDILGEFMKDNDVPPTPENIAVFEEEETFDYISGEVQESVNELLNTEIRKLKKDGKFNLGEAVEGNDE